MACYFVFLIMASVQSLSCVQLFATPCTAARQASLSITNSWSLLKLMSIDSVMPFKHLILYHPLFFLLPISPSIRVFPMSQLCAWGGHSIGVSALASVLPKYIQDWSPLFFFNYFILFFFRMDWLDLLEVQGTLKSLLQHHSSKASILWQAAFFTVQL